jgi:predicted nucleic acid-binding protein
MLSVDASVALKWYVEEPGTQAARRLFLSGEPLVAPELIIAEFCSAAWRFLQRQELTAKQYDELIAQIGPQFEDLAPMRPLSSRASTIARILNHPVYDCFYLALAEREDAPLVTADKRLLARVAETAWESQVVALDKFA